jgi:hypothetical protein
MYGPEVPSNHNVIEGCVIRLWLRGSSRSSLRSHYGGEGLRYPVRDG